MHEKNRFFKLINIIFTSNNYCKNQVYSEKEGNARI